MNVSTQSLDNFDWPPKALILLRYGIAIGRSYAKIAEQLTAEFKRPITKNAVSGKANRDLRKERK